MKRHDYTSSPDQPWLLSKPVIDQAGLQGSLILLAPGCERSSEPAGREQVWFVASGAVTACVDEVNTVLLQDEALHLEPGKRALLRNHGTEPARVLVLELPPARIEYLPLERSKVPV